MGQRANFIYPWGKKRLDHLAYDEGMVHMKAFPVLQWQYIPTFAVADLWRGRGVGGRGVATPVGIQLVLCFLFNFNSIVHPTPNLHSQHPPPPPPWVSLIRPWCVWSNNVCMMVTCGRGARFASWFASFLYKFQSRFVLYKYNAQLGTHLHPHMLEYMCVKATPPPPTPPPPHTHTFCFLSPSLTREVNRASFAHWWPSLPGHPCHFTLNHQSTEPWRLSPQAHKHTRTRPRLFSVQITRRIL